MGATLGGLILTGNRGLRQDMRQDMAQLETRLREDIRQLRGDSGWPEHSQAKLEGLLEGLREAISGRAAAS